MIACPGRWDKLQAVSELRAFLGHVDFYQEVVRLSGHHAAPLYSMLQLSMSEARRGSNHPLHWTPEPDTAFQDLKQELLKPLALFLVKPDKPLVIRTDTSDYATGTILEQTDDKGNYWRVAFWSRVLSPSQTKSSTASTKEAYLAPRGLTGCRMQKKGPGGPIQL